MKPVATWRGRLWHGRKLCFNEEARPTEKREQAPALQKKCGVVSLRLRQENCFASRRNRWQESVYHSLRLVWPCLAGFFSARPRKRRSSKRRRRGCTTPRSRNCTKARCLLARRAFLPPRTFIARSPTRDTTTRGSRCSTAR